MKPIVFVLLLLVFLTSVQAATIFDVKKINLETFTAKDNIYTVIGHDDFEQVQIRVNSDKNYLVDLDSCVKDGLDEYCYVDVDWDKIELDKFERESPAMHIKLNRLEPKISISRSISPSSFEIDEKAEVKLVIKNSGTKDAYNLQYYEKIPDNVRVVTHHDKLYYDGIGFSWNFGRLSPGNQMEYYYTVQPTKYKDGVGKANITFTYEGEEGTVQASDLKFDVKTPMDFSTSISPSSVGSREPAEYKVVVENDEVDMSIDAYMVISIPTELEVVSFGANVKRESEHLFILEKELPPQSDYDITIKVRGDFTGSYEFLTKGNFIVDGKYMYVSEEEKLDINSDKIEPKILLNVNQVRSGEPFEALVNLRNNNDKSFVNIDAIFSSEFFTEPIHLDTLTPGEEWQLQKKYFTTLVDEQTTFPIEVNGTFESLTGEKYTFYTKKDLSVSPPDETIKITHKINTKTINKGEEFNVEVSVQNLKDDALINIQADDFFPDAFEIVHGKASVLIDGISGKQTVNAYTYRVKVPTNYPLDSATLVSRFATIINGQEYTGSTESELTLVNTTTTVIDPITNETIVVPIENITEPNVTISPNTTTDNTTTENTTGNGGGGTTEEDDGFFTSLWNGLKDLIGKIF